MPLSELLKEKSSLRNNFKRKHKLPSTNKALGLLLLKNDELLEQLVEGLEKLPANFLIITDKSIDISSKNIKLSKKTPDFDLLAFDFVVGDSELVQISDYLKNGIVPIIPKSNSMGTVLSDYNAAKSEGNSFLFDDLNKWSIFYTITRYLENYKFPFDNKNLVKNAFEL